MSNNTKSMENIINLVINFQSSLSLASVYVNGVINNKSTSLLSNEGIPALRNIFCDIILMAKSKDINNIYIEFVGARHDYELITDIVTLFRASDIATNLVHIDIELLQKYGLSAAEVAGAIYANVSNASTIYGMDKFNTLRGHGFAAEHANHLFDTLTGRDATLVGGDNVKNGADRIVDNISIQSKYCRSGSACINECFDSSGNFKYLNPNGSPMQIEVPSDKYDAAITSLKDKISKGKVPGCSNPDDAEKIVRKGNFTYEQAKNIAKFGTIESITFDAVNGVIVATYAAGVSSALSFAVAIWNGSDYKPAIKLAAMSGLKVGGTAFVTSLISSQLARAGLNSFLVGSTDTIVSVMGPKASAILANAFRSGTNIYGAAAMKSASKLLRTNTITAAATFVVLSSVDVVDIFRGKISGTQLCKNLLNTASSVAGGSAGWVAGAAAGAALGSIVPGVGNAVGGIVGGLLGAFSGGTVVAKGTGKILDTFVEGDANKMVKIIEDIFKELAFDYLLNEQEAKNICEKLQGKLSGSELKKMFASNDKRSFAQNILVPIVENEVKGRSKIQLPSNKELVFGLREVLEELEDDAG